MFKNKETLVYLTIIIVVICFTIIVVKYLDSTRPTSTGETRTATANNQDPIAAPTPITFTEPANFECGSTISWADLENWQGRSDASICSNEPYYTVKGQIVGDRNEKVVKAEIYLPVEKKIIPASGGGIVQVDPSDGAFVAYYCIPQRDVSRQLWFQIFSSANKSKIGEKCIVTLQGQYQ